MRSLAFGLGFNDGFSEWPGRPVSAALAEYGRSRREARFFDNSAGVFKQRGGTMRSRVKNNKGGHPCRLDELGCPANGVEIDETGAARDKNEIGGLRRCVSLRPCGRRRVDDRQLEFALLCGFKTFRQATLG